LSTETNKQLTHRLFDDEFNKGNSATIDEVLAADYVDHSALPAPAPGVAGFKKRAAMLRAAFAPKMTFGDFLAEGDMVAFNWTMTGVHQGMFAGIPPTGKPIVVTGTNVERFRDGKIVEHWSQFDGIGLLRQISALPPPQKLG
jgi:predicted ester cyclase